MVKNISPEFMREFVGNPKDKLMNLMDPANPIMSGVVPMVAALMGPGAAGTAYIPALADFVPMVKGTSSMALAAVATAQEPAKEPAKKPLSPPATATGTIHHRLPHGAGVPHLHR